MGCQTCMEQWQESHSYCPNAGALDNHTQLVVGLADALAALHIIA